MGYLLLALSALALVGAGILWVADTHEKNAPEKNEQKSNAQEKAIADRGEMASEVPHVDPAPAQATPAAQAAQAVQDAQEAQDSEGAQVNADPKAPGQGHQEVTVQADGSEMSEARVKSDEAARSRQVEDDEAPEAAPAARGEEAPARGEEAPARGEAARREQRPKEKTHSRWGALSGAISGALPGAKQRGRRERREWAEANGFEYSKGDEFLQDEWGRGAASAGAPVRDVLTGTRFGHETRIADIGETTVVAMGTGMESGVVVDMRRKANAAANPAEDLVAVAELEGFRVFASEAGPAERMLDIRVSTALEMLPEQVSAVWCETEWVLAQLDGTPSAQDWEPVFAPLALLADAARTLPPRTWPHLHFDNQTREMGDPVEAPASSTSGEAEHVRPVVARPEEPLDLPTRTTGAVRGAIEYRTLGGDEVDAIATGEPPEQLNDGTRLTRRPQPPSIFDDGDADYPG